MASDRRSTELISCYFREGPAREAPSLIDDRTWSDLDMDEVFFSLDRTRSSVGQGCLYAMLRLPLRDAAELEGRAARVETLRKNDRARIRVSAILRRLGFQREGEVFQFLSTMPKKISDRRRFLYLGLSILAILGIPAAIFTGIPGIILLAAVLVTNMVLHYRFKAIVSVEAPSYEFLHRVLRAASALGKLEVPGLQDSLDELKGLAHALAGLRRRTAFLATPSGVSGDILSLLLEYIRQFFLQEVTTYFFVHNEIMTRMDRLVRLYTLVGEMDALASVATLRKERPLTVPVVQGSGKLLIEAEGLTHPLLEHPVANALRMEGKGLLVTGSNMSGKSTFLRTLGVNQVLATTIRVAFAKRLVASPLLTVSSITNRDSLLDAESHYIVEARRLLALLAAGHGSHPALLIIDEILSGTNSEERIAASTRILRHFAGLNCLVVAATHDRPIAAALEGVFENVHFTHRVDGEGLEFDYRLHAGIVEAGNAFRLLRLLGYPKEILDDDSGTGSA